MLKKLRVQLTFIYLASALVLALAVGGGTYSLISYYFQTTTDNALKVKMGLQLAALEIPLPIELYDAVRQAGLVITLPSPEGEENEGGLTHEQNEGIQESELADIFVFPLDETGTLIQGYTVQLPETMINKQAVQLALVHGSDLRTEKLDNGLVVRLFTYRVPGDFLVPVIQVGRYLTGQRIVLNQLFRTMVILGAVVTLLIGGAAWFLAGKTLRPTQQALDKQQAFVANASHELRAPLTLIRAGVEVALRNPSSMPQQRYLTDVLTDIDHMNKLIEDLLLLSRLDAKVLNLDLQDLKLIDFLSPLIRQLEIAAESRGIKLTSKIQNIRIKADPLRLKQTILIITDNALKHTPANGEIFIDTCVDGQFGEIIIRDTGAGIPDEYLEKVFDRFFKVPRRSTQESRGTGLGLSIAKSLVEIQEGSISINNVSPHGTEVIVRFQVPTI